MLVGRRIGREVQTLCRFPGLSAKQRRPETAGPPCTDECVRPPTCYFSGCSAAWTVGTAARRRGSIWDCLSDPCLLAAFISGMAAKGLE